MTRLFAIITAAAFFLAAGRTGAADPENRPALRALLLVSGGYHDYKKLGPFLVEELGRRVNADFELAWGLDRLNDPKFAEPFDLIVFNVCDDEIPDAAMDNALNAVRGGKPAVMIHCAVHAFRKSPKIAEWEACCGLRSKVHDPYGVFTVQKLDEAHPVTQGFPDGWKTPGDELYQMISIDPKAHPLLRVKSPHNGREHIVAWTFEYGKGRVFATTLGHDMKTTSSPEYLRLVANGLLWACGQIQPDGRAKPGYGRAAQ